MLTYESHYYYKLYVKLTRGVTRQANFLLGLKEMLTSNQNIIIAMYTISALCCAIHKQSIQNGIQFYTEFTITFTAC